MKIIRFFSTLIILIFVSQIRGQEAIDSLDFYYKKGDFNKAILIGEKIKNKLKNNNLTNTEDYANVLNYLSFIYLENNKYELSENIFKEAVDIEMLKDKNSFNYAISLYNLGDFYSRKGDFVLAESSLLESIKILYSNPDLDRQFLMDCYTKIGSLYLNFEEFLKSETNYKLAIEIGRVLYGENDLEYASLLNNLAGLYQKIENFEKAQDLYLKSYEIRNQNLNVDPLKSGILLNNLGSLNEILGNYYEAEKFYLESIELLETENNLRYSRSIGNLGLLYLKLDKLSQAKSLFEQQVEINKNISGENSIDYAKSISELAIYYNFNKDYLKSIEINTKALEITKNILGENHTQYATILNHLGNSYKFLENYKKSEGLLLKDLLILKGVLGENSYAYNSCLTNIIELYMFQNKFLEASNYIKLSFNPFKNKIYSYIDFLSTSELSNIKKKYSVFRLYPLVFLQKNPNQFPDVNIGSYEREIFLKSLLLRNQQRISKSIKISGNKELQNNYEKFVHNKRQLTKLDEIPSVKRPSNYEQIYSETETLEKDLVRQSSAFSEAKNNLSVEWKQIQEKLKLNEISIDLVAFNYYNKKWTDSIVYGAFIVSKKFKFPKYISLFEEKELELLLTNNKNNEIERINKYFLDKAISDLFLKPLKKELLGVTTIYLSPYRLGYQINFAGLPISETQTFGQKYQVHILSSTTEILNYKIASLDKKNNLELLLYGGIDYNKSNAKTEIKKKIFDANDDVANLVPRSGIKNFGYLKGTDNEVEQIKFKAAQNEFHSTILNGSEATEESIKQLDGRIVPYVLHLATHGFFFPDPIKEIQKDIFSEQGKSKIYKSSDDPMMRSGLLFAGANNYWGKSTENNTTDDGILTAAEISNLDLSACQLVVLSACETGLGEINGSEGVFGLQRAFKMAGVKNIIMSLWKVPDAQTAELFDIFYSECFAGKTIHEAFQSAQSKMQAKYSPYYWAGFVLLE